MSKEIKQQPRSIYEYDLPVEYKEEISYKPIVGNTCLGVDTSVSKLVSEGATNQALSYSRDMPPMDKMSLMDLKKLQEANTMTIDNLNQLKESLEAQPIVQPQQPQVEQPKTE